MTQPPPAPPPQPAPATINRRKAIALVAGAAVAAFAIGGGAALLLRDGGSDDKPTIAKATDTSPQSSQSASPSPAAERRTFKVGETVDIDDSEATFSAAALGYRDSGVRGVPEMLSAGQKWAVLEVKVCNEGSEPIQTSPFPWSLAYPDGVRVESAGMNAGDLPQPLYPMDAKVGDGDCVRGNIAFQVPKEGRPERVLYSPDTIDVPVEWRLGK